MCYKHNCCIVCIYIYMTHFACALVLPQREKQQTSVDRRIFCGEWCISPWLGQGVKVQFFFHFGAVETLGVETPSIPLKIHMETRRWINQKVQAGAVPRCYGVPTFGASGGACVYPRSMCLVPWLRSLARGWPSLPLGPAGQGRSQHGAKGWAARPNHLWGLPWLKHVELMSGRSSTQTFQNPTSYLLFAMMFSTYGGDANLGIAQCMLRRHIIMYMYIYQTFSC